MMATRPRDPMVCQPVRVRDVRRELEDTVTLVLAPPDRHGFRFAPGQFNMLYAFGVGEVPISISGPAAALDAVSHTVRDVGAVTRALCQLRRGDCVGVRGPFGTGWPLVDSEGLDLLVVAGGIGLAPLRPTLYEALEHRARYGRVTLLYGARTPADLLFRDELGHWRSRFDLEVQVTVDNATTDWLGDVGVVTQLVRQARIDPDNTIAMVCGPEVMMRFTVRELHHRGVPADRIYVSLERNMKCAIGLCGHCQLGPRFVCTDGPVFRHDRVERLLSIPEL